MCHGPRHSNPMVGRPFRRAAGGRVRTVLRRRPLRHARLARPVRGPENPRRRPGAGSAGRPLAGRGGGGAHTRRASPVAQDSRPGIALPDRQDRDVELGRTAIESIRYRVDAIDQEIAYLDRELSVRLEAYSRRTGPWLLVGDAQAPAQLWFVAAAPCSPVGDVAVAADGSGPWIAATATADPDLPLADLPGACAPWRLAVDGDVPWHGSGRVRLRVDAETWDFRFDG